MHTDGGVGVGLGHVSRGLGLANALENEGLEPIFFITSESGLREFIEQQGHKTIVDDISKLQKICIEEKLKRIVIDSYRVDSETLSKLHSLGLVVIYFDDKGNSNLPVSMVINGSPSAQNLNYNVKPFTRLLLGSEYQIVRSVFAPKVERNYNSNPQTLLVTLGGDDLLSIFDELFTFFQNSICVKWPHIKAHFIVGPFFSGKTNSSTNCIVHRNPQDIRSLMIEADIAISAGGQTLFELARCALPIIAFAVGEDQLPNLNSLAKNKAIRYIGWAKKKRWLERLESELNQLIENPFQRQSLGGNSSRLIDGKGASRIVQEIVKMTEQKDVAYC